MCTCIDMDKDTDMCIWNGSTQHKNIPMHQ